MKITVAEADLILSAMAECANQRYGYSFSEKLMAELDGALCRRILSEFPELKSSYTKFQKYLQKGHGE